MENNRIRHKLLDEITYPFPNLALHLEMDKSYHLTLNWACD